MPAGKHGLVSSDDPLPRNGKQDRFTKADRQSKKVKRTDNASDANDVAEFLPIPGDDASHETQYTGHVETEQQGQSAMSGQQQQRKDEHIGQPAPSNKERRNAARREERRGKMMKRQRTESAQNLAPLADTGVDGEEVDGRGETRQPERKKVKKGTASTNGASPERVKQDTRGSKGDGNTKKNGRAPKAANPNAEPIISNRTHAAEETDPKEAVDTTKSGKSQRFIAFIGNLPYSATSQTITQHFSAIAPFSVRAPTDPKTGKAKGYAFLEFEGYDKMKTCLKLYHHSTFGEGKSARKINVELTAGGGGKGENRKAKIKEKNEKLSEERKRTHEEEAKARRTGVKGKGKPQVEGPTEEDEEEHADVHPSRRKRMGL